MSRWHVHIVNMRARDIKVGDVVAKDPSKFDNWFRVQEIRQLGDGTYNILDKGNTRSFTAGPFDLVGLQTPVPLPAEAERNVRREQASHPDPTEAATPGATPAQQAQGAPTESSADGVPPTSSQAASREAAARQAVARGEGGGGARALPGA